MWAAKGPLRYPSVLVLPQQKSRGTQSQLGSDTVQGGFLAALFPGLANMLSILGHWQPALPLPALVHGRGGARAAAGIRCLQLAADMAALAEYTFPKSTTP